MLKRLIIALAVTVMSVGLLAQPISSQASGLKTTGASVNVSQSAPPSGSGFSLVTTDATHATWQAGGGGSGNVVGPASSVNNQLPIFSGTTGKLLAAFTGTGLLKVTSGVVSTATAGTDYQAAGNYITALTGDGTANGPGSVTFTFATVNSSPGTVGDASHVAQFTDNGKGLVTSQSSVAIQIAESAVTGLTSDLAAKQATGNYITALTGNVVANGPGSAAATIQPGVVTLAMQADMATASLFYRKTAGSGAPEVNTLATLKTDLGLTGTNSGDQIVPVNTTGTASNWFSAYDNTTGIFTKSRPACADLSNAAATCSSTDAANLTGTLALARFPTQATNTILGNATSGTAIPTALAIGGCSSSSSALIWTTNTGFGCNSAIVASSATSATNATNAAITDDNSTNATMFPLWVTTNTGNLPLKTSSTFLQFNPTVGLSIGGTAPLTKLTVYETSSTSPRGILSVQNSTDTMGSRVGFSKSRGTAGSPTTIVTGDTLGRLMFRGHDGTAYLEMASIEAVSIGTIATNRVPTYLAFSTATDAAPSVLTERMRIGSDGIITMGAYGAGVHVSSSAGVISSVAPGTSGNLLTSNGTTWLSSAPPAAGAACSTCTSNVLQKGNGANTLQDSGITEASSGALTTGAGTAVSLAATAPTAAASTTAGVSASLTASPATAGTTNAGAAVGGNVTITSGAAAQKTSGNAVGGDIQLNTGNGVGTGAAGKVTMGNTGSVFVAPNGTAALPSTQWAGSFQNDGWWYDSTNHVLVKSVNSVNQVAINQTPQVKVNSSGVFGFTSTTDADTGADTAISRSAAGVVAFGTGAQGSAVGWPIYGGTSRVKTSDVTNATATMSAITGMTSTVAAGRFYSGTMTAWCNNSVAAEGIQFDFNGGTATMTSFHAGAAIDASGGTDVVGTNISTALATALTFTTMTGETMVTVKFSFKVNAAGTFIPRFAEATTATGTATVRVDSFLILTDTQ